MSTAGMLTEAPWAIFKSPAGAQPHSADSTVLLALLSQVPLEASSADLMSITGLPMSDPETNHASGGGGSESGDGDDKGQSNGQDCEGKLCGEDGTTQGEATSTKEATASKTPHAGPPILLPGTGRPFISGDEKDDGDGVTAAIAGGDTKGVDGATTCENSIAGVSTA